MPETTPEAPKQNTSRRFVLKAGAHAAWAIPAIQIAASTPAFAAASGVTAAPPHGTISIATATFSRNGSNGSVALALTNAGDADVKDVKLTLSGAGVNLNKKITADAGWDVTTGTSSASITHSGTSLVVGGKVTVTVDFTVADSSNGAANGVTVAATGTKSGTADGAVVGDSKSTATL